MPVKILKWLKHWVNSLKLFCLPSPIHTHEIELIPENPKRREFVVLADSMFEATCDPLIPQVFSTCENRGMVHAIDVKEMINGVCFYVTVHYDEGRLYQ
jgi:hypothetical protein